MLSTLTASACHVDMLIDKPRERLRSCHINLLKLRNARVERVADCGDPSLDHENILHSPEVRGIEFSPLKKKTCH